MKWLGLIIAVLLAVFFMIRNQSPASDAEAKPNSSDSVEAAIDQGNPVQFIGQSPFTDEYGDPDRDVGNDLKVVNIMLHHSQSLIKNFDSYFLPENREIIQFLQGKNRDRLAWIPKGHQFINDQGELVDRWGTPVFFHRESGSEFELRSAGPDRKHWTSDDISSKPKSIN